MSAYGISAVKIDEQSGQIAAVKLHTISHGLPDSGTVTVDEGRALDYKDVANLIVAGDEIRILASDGSGVFKCMGDHIRKEPGCQFGFIESCDADGVHTKALFELPPF